MSCSYNPVLEKVSNLNTFRRGDRRAPHKPLLLLVAIGALTRGRRELPFSEVEKLLTPLLNVYAPPVRSRHQPELPYWHLISDKLWSVEAAETFPRQGGGPKMEAIRNSVGRLSDDLVDLIDIDPESIATIVDIILEEHFPPSVHEDLITAAGIKLSPPQEVKEQSFVETIVRYRDPKFRQMVLRAYEHKCAVTGFRAALGGAFLAVKLHIFNGMRITDPTQFLTELRLNPLFTSFLMLALGL